MKQKDVMIGRTYFTKVSGELVKVKVLGETKDYFSGRTKFVVQRTDNGRTLKKGRSAAALRGLGPLKRETKPRVSVPQKKITTDADRIAIIKSMGPAPKGKAWTFKHEEKDPVLVNVVAGKRGDFFCYMPTSGVFHIVHKKSGLGAARVESKSSATKLVSLLNKSRADSLVTRAIRGDSTAKHEFNTILLDLKIEAETGERKFVGGGKASEQYAKKPPSEETPREIAGKPTPKKRGRKPGMTAKGFRSVSFKQLEKGAKKHATLTQEALKLGQNAAMISGEKGKGFHQAQKDAYDTVKRHLGLKRLTSYMKSQIPTRNAWKVGRVTYEIKHGKVKRGRKPGMTAKGFRSASAAQIKKKRPRKKTAKKSKKPQGAVLARRLLTSRPHHREMKQTLSSRRVKGSVARKRAALREKKARTKHITRILWNAPTNSGNRKGWAKVVTGIRSGVGTKAFDGYYLKSGYETDLPVGSIVIEISPEGSVRDRWESARGYRVVEDGLREATTEYKWRKQFLSFKDAIRELIK